MKKLIGMLCAITMIAALWMPAKAAAVQGPCWTQKNGEQTWTYTDGQDTSLTAKIQGTTLYIQGKGAVPAYDREVLGNRPWHNKTIYALVISKDITSIGAEAFSNLKDLHQVSMYSGTFIESPTAFGGASDGCIFEIAGTDIVSRNIGNVPYNSLDSIAAFMQSFNGKYKYKLANYYMTTWVQNTVSPKIDNLSPMDAKTSYANQEYPIYDYKSELSFVSPKPDYTMSTSIASTQQGKAALEAFSIVLGDNTYVTAYNISINSVRGVVKNTEEPLTYSMTIPKAFQYPGRQFRLIQLGNGVINILEDEDTNDATMTFTTNYPSTAYALVYQDAVTADYVPNATNP